MPSAAPSQVEGGHDCPQPIKDIWEPPPQGTGRRLLWPLCCHQGLGLCLSWARCTQHSSCHGSLRNDKGKALRGAW